MRGDIGGVGTGGQTGGVHGHNEGSAGVHHVYKLGMRDPARENLGLKLCFSWEVFSWSGTCVDVFSTALLTLNGDQGRDTARMPLSAWASAPVM